MGDEIQLVDLKGFVAFAALCVLALRVLALGGDDLPRGALVERVVCRDDPGEAYALYLPSAYSPDRRWPTVYALDASGRALVPAELLKEGAERYGFVVVSSYGSRSGDEATDPNVKALGALWRDTRERFALDERRAYAAGFSGTARSLTRMADLVPGSLAGVVACGAGFAPDRPPRAGLAFSVFAVAGEADFNYQEVQRLGQTLAALGVPHRIESFEGRHQWPPAPLLSDALAWLEVRGMREERRARDQGLVATLLARWQEEAAALERAGGVFEAERRYAGLARDFDGLADVSTARAAAARIRGGRAYEEERRLRLKWRAREEEYEPRAQRALSLLSVDDAAGSLQSTLAELGLAELRKRAASAAERDERVSAQRSLAKLAVQTGFYLPRSLRQRGDHGRTALVLAVAAEARPEDPDVWYNLACARAQAGWKRDAVKALERAVEVGFQDAAWIESDAELAPLHGETGYRALLDRLSARAKP